MAVTVKIPRLKLLGKLEEVKERMEKDHRRDLVRYEGRLDAARKKLATDLRAKADDLTKLNRGDTTPFKLGCGDEGYWEGEDYKRRPYVELGSPVRIPTLPQEHRELSEVKRVIALLDASEDEIVKVSTADLRFYGLAAIAGGDD